MTRNIHVRHIDIPQLFSSLIMKNPVDSFLVRRLRQKDFSRRLRLEHNRETLLWGHRRWCRCISLRSHLCTPCALHIRLHCRCVLLCTHRLGSRWIRLRGHRLRNRCFKLYLGWRRKEIWMHAKPSSRIPSLRKNGRRPILHRCSNRWCSRVDRICCNC